MTEETPPREVGSRDQLGPTLQLSVALSADDVQALTAWHAAVIAAERERCIQIVETYQVPVGNSAAGEMAAEWTMDALREVRDAIGKA